MDIITQLRNLGFRDLTYDVARLRDHEIVQRALHLTVDSSGTLKRGEGVADRLETVDSTLTITTEATQSMPRDSVQTVNGVDRAAHRELDNLIDKAVEQGYIEVVELVRRAHLTGGSL